MGRGVQDRRRRVVAVNDAAFKAGIFHGSNCFVKALALKLVVPTALLVGGGKMREHAVALNTAMEVDRTAELDHIRVMHANAIHARLDNHMVLANLTQLRRTLAIRKSKLKGIDRRHDVMLEQQVDRLGRRLAQQQDGRYDAAFAQLDAFLDRGYSKHIGTGRIHDLGAGNGTVAVSVGLDHAAQALTWVQQVFKCARVATQRTLVDLDPGPAVLRQP